MFNLNTKGYNMIQGSNMTRRHNGMGRKGLSLMEMLVAIILLGIISSIGYNYYKNYYDTSLAAKQVKVSVLIDQAAQLKNAMELYKVKFGQDVNITTTVDDLGNGIGLLLTQRIITEIPAPIPDITTDGFFVANGLGDINSTLIQQLNGTGANELVLTYELNGTTSAKVDRIAYCNAVNNIASNGVITYTNTAATYATAAWDDLNKSAELANNTFFCWDSDNTDDAAGLQLVFISKIY